jgi:hypothetical protein
MYKLRDVKVTCTGCGLTITNQFRVSEKQAAAGFTSMCVACFMKKYTK